MSARERIEFLLDEGAFEETDKLKMSYYTYPRLRALFLHAGLEIVQEYGSFEKTPLDNSAVEMSFLLRQTKRSGSQLLSERALSSTMTLWYASYRLQTSDQVLLFLSAAPPA